MTENAADVAKRAFDTCACARSTSRSTRQEGGTPVIRGTRVPVRTLAQLVEGGESLRRSKRTTPTSRRRRTGSPCCGQRAIPAEGGPGQHRTIGWSRRSGVKLWSDECLSPTLVRQANRRGYWATCNRDRDLLGARDDAFQDRHCRRGGLRHQQRARFHCPLPTSRSPHRPADLPQTQKREALWPLLDAALDYIERQAKAVAETAAEWMLNRRVEIDPSGTATHEDLPAAG